jgi:glycosyltransferase involved in cell wall biosynthesis
MSRSQQSEPALVSTGIIIPALNAAAHLPALLDEIKQLHPDFRLLVVDDGSQDGTAAVARQAGAEVIQHPDNRGKGAALDTGHHWALTEKLDWVYTMDADGQHLPAELQSFMTEASDGQWDVVVGTRMADTADMPWIREATNRFTSQVISTLAGCTIPDSQSGYRLFRVACLEGLNLRTTRYDTESEILVRLAWRHYSIGAVPISTVYGEETSSIRPLVDTGRFFRLVFLLLRDRFS